MTNKIYDFDRCPNRVNTNSVKWDLRQARFGKSEVIPMWVADMDFETPDFILQRIRERLDHPVLGYTYRDERYNEAFIDWARRKYSWKIDKEWLEFAPGVVSAVTMLVETFTEPGDEIITQPPVYFPFFMSIEGTGRKLVHNPLKEKNGRLEMDFEQLESVISPRTSMIIISNPHNPGGSAWTAEELMKLGEICKKHHIRVLSDEIHSDLVFEPATHTPFAKVVSPDEVSSITCMAASKSFNLAGLSTSFVIIPEKDLKKKYQERLHITHVGMGNIFGSIATETAYREGWNWMQQLLAYLKANRDYMSQYFNTHLPDIRMLIPEATYLAWVDFSALGMNQTDLNNWLLEDPGLAFNTGTMFGPGGEGFMRINFACSRNTLEQALNQLHQSCQKL